MKTTSSTMKTNLKRLIAGVGIAVALPLAAYAQPAPGGERGADRPNPEQFHRGGPGMHHGFGHHGEMGPGAFFLRGINLSEAQRDKIFAIHHALAPQMYEKSKLVRKSHEELRGMATSPQYDEARVKAAIDAGARAKADLAFLRVRSEHDIFSILTPEQKAQVEKNRANFMQHRMSMEERGGPRGPGGPGMPQ